MRPVVKAWRKKYFSNNSKTLRFIGIGLIVLALVMPLDASAAQGASTVLVGGVSTDISNSTDTTIDNNIVSLTPTVVSQKQPTVQITLVESPYQQEQAVLAAQKAAQAAAQAAKAKQLEATASTPAIAQASNAEKITTVQKAAATFGINWKILAAVWQVESGSQWVTSEQSSAGAVGPCQFLPSTWASYAYDGDGNGTKSIYDASDCLYGAAKLLANNGAASGDNVDALLHYNHSMAYVDRVLSVASSIQG